MDGVRWLNNPMIGVEQNAVTLLWHCAADIAVINDDDDALLQERLDIEADISDKLSR